NSNGSFTAKWGSYGTGDGQFRYPHGVAVDAGGNLYVADTNNHRIQKFDSSGTFITKWGSYGTGDGQFKYPYGVAVDSSGNLYVADRDNNRIQKFRPSTPTPYGSLSIASTPSGAKIYLDGVDTGSVTTQTFTNISAETHTIKLALSGYQDWYGTTTVIAGSTTYVYATLTLIQGIPISLSLSPKTATTTADGSITFMAIAKDSNGNTWTVTCKTIFSGNDPIGTMSANIYYPGKVGTRIITATYTTLMATATVSVSHGSATIISISPQDLSTYVGVSTNYSATGTDTDGNSFGVLATFAITAGAGTFTDNKFEAGSAGTYEITAHYLNLIATTTVKIEPHGAAVKISLKISTNTTTADGAIACTVYGTDTNNVCWDATDVSTFTTTDQKGTFTNNIYSPGKVGIWVIKAELGTLNATATVTVIHGLPVKLDIAPAITTLTADSIQTYKGTATDSDGNQWDATANITWSKNDPVGTMTANIYYPGKIGTWTITGTINGIVGTATVNVISGAFTNLKIVSLPATTTTSATFTITVTLCDNDGNPYSGILAMTNTTQSITPSTITLISGTGTATAKITKSPEGGTDTITVAYGSITATRTIRVFISSQYGGTITGSCVIIDIGTISATCFARITTSANEPTLPGGIKFAGTVYNIDLFDEQGNRVGTEAGQMGTVTVRLLYLDDNNDGIVDGTNIQELDLSIYHLENGTWTALLPTTVNDTKNFALAYVTHFSTFTLAGTPTVTPFAINNNDVYVYPNPYKEGKTNFDGDYIYFSQVSQEAVIKIYNIVGELIKTIDKCPYEWNISSENIASGVYIYVVTGGGGGKSVGKIGIVK
ncbi:PEGA domain-containing protein, partial [bacterium]|nr:PEGA domain-containing protein [bacterium]